jgi:hypothetical protein
MIKAMNIPKNIAMPIAAVDMDVAIKKDIAAGMMVTGAALDIAVIGAATIEPVKPLQAMT